MHEISLKDFFLFLESP